MQAVIRSIFSKKAVPIAWTLLITILLCIPGSMVPGDGLFGIKGLDKLVHAGLFGSLVLFWGWHFKIAKGVLSTSSLVCLAVVCSLFGALMEFVQMYWVPNRSFDGYDIVADAIGAALAAVVLGRFSGV